MQKIRQKCILPSLFITLAINQHMCVCVYIYIYMDEQDLGTVFRCCFKILLCKFFLIG